MRVILLISFLLLTIQTHAEQYKAGLILPIDPAAVEYSYMQFPAFGLNLYEKPRADKLIGCLGPEYINEGAHVYPRLLIENQGDIKELPYKYMEAVGYEVYAIGFQGVENGFIQILDDFWVDIEELKKNGFKPANWMDFLIQESGNVLGYFANEPGLNLRKGPSAQMEKIITIFTDRMQIDLTEEVEGLWNKVSVTVHDIDPCEGEQKVVKRYEGWVKLLDDDGTPNISWYPKGC